MTTGGHLVFSLAGTAHLVCGDRQPQTRPAGHAPSMRPFFQGEGIRVRLPFGSGRPGFPVPTGVTPILLRHRALPPDTTNTQRNPILSLRLPGSLLLRLEESRLRGSLLFHDPPRNTRRCPAGYLLPQVFDPPDGDLVIPAKCFMFMNVKFGKISAASRPKGNNAKGNEGA